MTKFKILITLRTFKMLPLCGILIAILACRITAYPMNGDHSSLAQHTTLNYVMAAEIFKRDQYRDQPQNQPTVQPIVQPRQQSSTQLSPVPTVAPTQSCHCISHFLWNSYTVLIRVPYGGTTLCDATYHALEDATASITDWGCVESDGFIKLWFSTEVLKGHDVNSALSSCYPQVTSGFNCPYNC